MRVLTAALSLLLVCAAYGQSEAGVTLTLSVKEGRTRFRIGEQIDVELRFAATRPAAYRLLSTAVDRRYARERGFDSFTAEPAADTRDPLLDSATLMSGGLARKDMGTNLGVAPVAVPGIVNDWVSFRRAGRYRITAESTRVVSSGVNAQRLNLRSHPVEIEVVVPEPGWREERLRHVAAELEAAAGSAQQRDPEAVQHAARSLRYLETAEAVPLLVRFFENGPVDAQQDIRAGLLASPWRTAVIAAMERALDDPDTSVTLYWIGTLMQLEYARRYGPREHGAERVFSERFQPIQQHYEGKLAAAIPGKRGRARALSLETLLAAGSGAHESVRKVLVSEFLTLPDDVQFRLLMRWQEFGGRDLAPALEAVARRGGPARDAALERLLEVSPGAARDIVTERIRRRDLGDPRTSHPLAFLFLPDERLPDLDASLVRTLDHPFGALLVARYASDAALPQVRAWVEREPEALCWTAIAAYLFRADPGYATERLAESRKGRTGCTLNLPTGAIRLLMSPALERAAIADLASTDPSIRRQAQTLLQHGGSAGSRAALWDAFRRMRDRPIPPAEAGIETGFVDALIQGFGWVLTPAELDEVEHTCVSPSCRDFAHSQRRALDRPVNISRMPHEGWVVVVGGTATFTPEQTREKIRQFPAGTAFQLPGKGGDVIRAMLTEAGMQVQGAR